MPGGRRQAIACQIEMDPARSIVGLNYFGSCAGGRDVSIASDYAGTAAAAVFNHASAALSWRRFELVTEETIYGSAFSANKYFNNKISCRGPTGP
jgi:hypothetical protein